MSVTKVTKMKADYHTWDTSEVSNGDILGIEDSLGRPANQLTIESIGGQSTIRLNVCQKIFGNQSSYNSWIPDAAFFTHPVMVDEVEIEKDDIIIESGATWLWENEYPIRDIKIVTKATNIKILVS